MSILLCDKCLLPSYPNNKLDIAWNGTTIVHENCRICQLCGKSGDVKQWTVEKADGIPYAHLSCLQKMYCPVHKNNYPCADEWWKCTD